MRDVQPRPPCARDAEGHLFALWGLPASIIDAVVFHHEPSKANQTEVSILTLVHAADAIVTQHHNGVLNPGSICVDEAYISGVGLNDHYQDWLDAYAERI